ncbi:uncharacterized protein LOC117913656 isoform X1 [Vitis riparia]|uniref:uncharacterized protein LOC117913656 isoform X1 n=2 Tax=Vitis riparia TaxID=96939 RepID=UPI00155AF2B9|nr:uncharacterized protein LOC117913656 isoform X1 [Vitis riparia]
MKLPNCVSQLADSKSRRSCVCSIFPTASVLCLMFFIGSVLIGQDYSEKLSRWGMSTGMLNSVSNKCENQCRANGSEALPKGIVVTSSDLDMRPLWGFPKKRKDLKRNLLAVAVGVKQKDLVNKMVEKFLSYGFVVMLFHYDGVVDEWKDFKWCDRVLHVAAINQTKWWFAKRFLHPEIVAEYNYIFLWDEDLGVTDFNPRRYVATVQREGLEISQPALDGSKSEVHHQITLRGRRSDVHRRIFKSSGSGKICDENSTAPPCTGWIEVMAPVFSREAWRCVWYMIQNDLIHAWGLDMQLGYCAQGDRTKNVGVVDSDYIVHYGLPTLGANDPDKTTPPVQDDDSEPEKITTTTTAEPPISKLPVSSTSPINFRVEVRRQSYIEYNIFKKRWRQAVKEDKCWKDPYQQLGEKNTH